LAKQRNQSTALFNIQNLLQVKPLTENQTRVFDYWGENYNLVLSGSAGGGKSFLALYLALKSFLLRKYERIVLFRSTVPTRNQGFLKGDLSEKQAPFEDVYRAIFSELLPTTPNSYDTLKKEKTLEFKSTSFVRGLTISNSVVIVDEFQNLNFHELQSVITRIGENSRIIFAGDYLQSDFRFEDEKSGVLTFLKVLANMPEDFQRVDFKIEDIVRSGLCKRYLLAEHNLRQRGQL
jgi:phosphate starvation-inducible protein PhoH and related proteins